MQLAGKVLSVDTLNIAESTVNDEAVGSTVLELTDATSFLPDGGTCIVEGVALPYVSVDYDADTLTLAAPLTSALPADSRVEVYPPAPEKYATVDLGGEGEAVPVLVPHHLVELLPDGIRDPLEQETVTVETGGYALIVTDVVARELAKGTVDPDRLSVGVIKNLVQDPQLTTSLREVGAPWSILGPDATFTESNYLRCAATGALADFYLTDAIPVEAGTNLAFSALIRPTSAPASATAFLRVEFVAPDGTRLSGATELAEVALVDAPDGVWTPVSSTFSVPQGYTSALLRYGTTGLTAGTVDFVKPLAQALWSQVQSGDYVPGESGWSWSDDTAQAESLNVIGALGAGVVSAESLIIGGADLATLLDSLPKGLMQFGRAALAVNTAEISSETIMWEFDAGPVTAGRAYELTVHGHIDATTVDAVFDLLVRYTGDGSAPTLTSAIMDGTLTKFPVPHVYPRDAFEVRCTYLPQQDYPRLRTALCMRRESGSGTAHVTVTDINRALEFRMVDLGRFTGVLTGSLSQKSKVTGTPDGDPTTSYVREFPTTWARTFDGTGSATADQPRSPDNPDSLQIGYASSTHGRAFAVFGFDDTSIRNALIGVTPVRCELTFRVKKAYASTGLDVAVLTTQLSAPPSSTATRTGWQLNRASFSDLREGSTYTVDLPVAVASEFKAGTTKGLGLYALDSSIGAHGTIYGSGTAYEPVLRITGTF